MKHQNPKRRLSLHCWVTPVTQARYWAGLIGVVIAVSASPKRDPEVKVRFEYHRNGTKLERTEIFSFPASRLKLVSDFRARLRKAKPSNPSPSKYAELAVIEAEEVSHAHSTQKASVSRGKLAEGDSVVLLHSLQVAEGTLPKGVKGRVVTLLENGEHVAVEFPRPGLSVFRKMHHSYLKKEVA